MAFIDFDVDMLRRYLKETERLLQSAKKREISAYRERLQLEGKAHRRLICRQPRPSTTGR